MNEVLDANQVAAQAISSIIKDFFSGIAEKVSSSVSESWVKVFEDFKPFMEDTYRRNSYVRLLSNKDKDEELMSIYVHSEFSCSGEVIGDHELIQRIRDGKNVVINGNGGAGKTFFMRYLWLTLFNEGGKYTPIFLELRRLNDLTSTDIIAFIRHSISPRQGLSQSVFESLCDSGRFCFILDGFDEVTLSIREIVQAQILKLCQQHPSCRVVVSSRYEGRFAGWQNFDLFESLPFDLPRVRELVEKVPFDQPTKKLFLKRLSKEFFKENKSFLSTPLLAIMMMMTFKDNMDIPRRMHIFYDQAFSTLYQWHDATKTFQREKTLDIDEFKRSFGVFCLLSYHQEKFEFTHSEIIELIKHSNKISAIGKSPELILRDYEENVNLLRQDGLKYVFIHRSFQEYFCAYAMVRLFPEKFSEVFEGVKYRYSDSTLSLCYEMNSAIVIEGYLTPLYRNFESDIVASPKSDKEYELAASLDLKVRGHILKIKDNENKLVFGSSIEARDNVQEFLINAGKLSGAKRRSLNDLLSREEQVTWAREMLNVVKDHRPLTSFEMLIEYHSGELIISLKPLEEGDEHGNSTLDEIALLYKKYFRKNHQLPTQLEKYFESEVKGVKAWVERVIKDSERRSKSLDSILGL